MRLKPTNNTPLGIVVDGIAKFAGGEEWLVPVAIEQDDGSMVTQEIYVVANSEEEATEAAILRARLVYGTTPVAKQGVLGRVIAAPYSKEKSKHALMPGGYRPGTLLKGVGGDLVKMVKKRRSGEQTISTVAASVQSRNGFIALCVHLALLPLGLIFFYVGFFSDVHARSALSYFNQYVFAGALCWFIGITGCLRAWLFLKRLDKVTQQTSNTAPNDQADDDTNGDDDAA